MLNRTPLPPRADAGSVVPLFSWKKARTQDKKYKKSLTHRARWREEIRRGLSSYKEALPKHLYATPVCGRCVDFLAPEANVAVKVINPERKIQDYFLAAALSEFGYTVVTIRGEDLDKGVGGVLDELLRALGVQKHGRPHLKHPRRLGTQSASTPTL